jgi:hypothetical protein
MARHRDLGDGLARALTDTTRCTRSYGGYRRARAANVGERKPSVSRVTRVRRARALRRRNLNPFSCIETAQDAVKGWIALGFATVRVVSIHRVDTSWTIHALFWSRICSCSAALLRGRLSSRSFRPMASDTTQAALEAQVLAARRLGPEGRLRVAAELSEDVRQISIEGVLRRNPKCSYEQARRQVLRKLWGEPLACRVWPNSDR